MFRMVGPFDKDSFIPPFCHMDRKKGDFSASTKEATFSEMVRGFAGEGDRTACPPGIELQPVKQTVEPHDLRFVQF